MRREQDYHGDDNFATAIAATAFAIHLLEESHRKIREESAIPLNREKFWKDVEPIRPARSTSALRPSSGQDRSASSLVRGVTLSFKRDDKKQRGKVRRERKPESKVDAWERSEMEKIKKRYEKIENGILAWENESKKRAKHQQEKKKSELELRRERNMKHYHMKVARIENIAEGAKSQAKEKRKEEELIAKKRAEKFRTAKNAPLVYCFCF